MGFLGLEQDLMGVVNLLLPSPFGRRAGDEGLAAQ